MSKPKITYFDFPGGRAEPIRMALAIGGIDYEDERISFPQFGEMVPSLPLGAVPVFEIEGTTYTQTNAMLRYAGAKAGLYPNDPWQAFLCDEVLDICEDMFHAIGKTFGLEGDEFKQARETLSQGPFTRVLKLLVTRLEDAGGEYFAEERLTVADFKVFVAVRMVLSGTLDHIPADLVQQVAPKLMEHMQLVESDPQVAKYLQSLG